MSAVAHFADSSRTSRERHSRRVSQGKLDQPRALPSHAQANIALERGARLTEQSRRCMRRLPLRFDRCPWHYQGLEESRPQAVPPFFLPMEQ
jgi:hypothetical protein